MLTETDRQLLTTYVDGEASARQRRAAERLLHRSPEARALLGRLQCDSRRLRGLPQPPHFPDLADRVLRTIEEHGIRPAAPAARHPTAIPLWKGMAAAAAVLLAVGATSFLAFQELLGPAGRPSVTANQEGGDDPYASDPDRSIPGPDPDGTETAHNHKPPTPPDDHKKPAPPGPGAVARKPDENTTPEKKVPERPTPDDIVTAPDLGSIRPSVADVIAPELFRLHALTDADTFKGFRAGLEARDAVYVELLARDGTAAFPLLRQALKAHGIELAIGPLAEIFLKKPKLKTNYLVFAENVTPERLAAALRYLGVKDPRVSEKNPQSRPIYGAGVNLFVLPMGNLHRNKLAAHLGADPRPLKEEKAPAGSSADKPAANLAFATAYDTPLPRQPSAARQRFLDARRPPREGTLQVMIVLRNRP